MYKLKYYSLTKEEKIKLKKDFYNTEFGKGINKRLIRLFITGILCIIVAVYLFITRSNLLDLIYSILLTISAIIFIVGSFAIRITKLNDYLIKKKK